MRGVALQFGEIVEGIGAAQFAGVNQAHEKIADLGAIERAVKQCILAMEHRAFQHLFAEIMPTTGLCRVAIVHYCVREGSLILGVLFVGLITGSLRRRARGL